MQNQFEDSYPVKIIKGDKTYDLHVMWSIHNKCNYSCSYCPDELHNGSISWMRLDLMKGFIDKVHKHYVEGLGFENILFSFTGGEPTLWPDFRKFLEYINSYGFRVGLTTNAHVSVNYWKQVSTYLDYICMSYHPESADVDHFISVFEYLHNDEKTVVPSVRVMMHSEDRYWKKSIELIEKLKKFPNWTYECVHILDDYGATSTKIEYESEEKESYIKENSFKYQFNDPKYTFVPTVGFNHKVEFDDGSIEKLDENKLINTNRADFEGWDCYIGVEQLFIQFSGIIKRAGCNVGSYLGNLMEYEKIQFPSSPTKCTRNTCNCPTDVRITKFSPGTSYDLKYFTPEPKIKKITAEGSLFKYRVVVEHDPSANAKIDRTKLFNFIEAKSISENISAEKVSVLEEIASFTSMNQDQLLANLVGEKKYTHSIRLKDPKLDEVEDSVFALMSDFYDFIHLEFHNYCSVQKLQKIMFLIKKNVNIYLKITIKWDSYVEHEMHLRSLVSKLIMLSLDLEIIGLPKDLLNMDKLSKRFYSYNQLENTLTYSRVDYQNTDLLLYRKRRFVDEEVVEAVNGEMFKTSTDGIMGVGDFHNWNCSMGSNNCFVDKNSNILTSQCEQATRIGSLNDLNINLGKPEPVICKQKKCRNRNDCLVAKELV